MVSLTVFLIRPTVLPHSGAYPGTLHLAVLSCSSWCSVTHFETQPSQILKRRIYVIVSLASQITEPLYLSPGFASPEIPLVLALITSVVLTAWVTAYLFHRLSPPTQPTLRTIILQQLRYGGLVRALDIREDDCSLP
jgi:hypothetical protein